jgi:hypothetical protein
MAGHINRENGQAVKPVDYKGGERSNHFCSEFHHIIDTASFFELRIDN